MDATGSGNASGMVDRHSVGIYAAADVIILDSLSHDDSGIAVYEIM